MKSGRVCTTLFGLIELASEEPLSESQVVFLTIAAKLADQLRRTADDLTELGRPEGPLGAGAAFEPLGGGWRNRGV